MEKKIYEFEGTPLEAEIDSAAEMLEFGDEIFISPDSNVTTVEADKLELFKAQNDLTNWTRVVWGTEL